MLRKVSELAALVILLAVLGSSHAFAYRTEDIIFSSNFFGQVNVFVSDNKAFCDTDRDQAPSPISGYELSNFDMAEYYFASTRMVIFYRDLGTSCRGGEWIALDLMRCQATLLELKGPPCEEVVHTQITGNYIPLKDNSVEITFTQFGGAVTKIIFPLAGKPLVK